MKSSIALFKSLPASAVALILLSVAPSGFAAVANVSVGSTHDQFTPAVTSINVGDKVIWTWAGTPHSTTSGTNGIASGLWDSGVISTLPHSFTNTFSNPGIFSYYCSIHYPFGMTGAVIVASANLPPMIAITSPTNGTVFSAPANVTIHAMAADPNGTVTNVQFLVGASVLTNQAVAPFAATTNNLAAGSYEISAVATDNGGLTATNLVTINIVAPFPLSITTPQWLPPANFQFTYPANVGLSYVVQRSTSLLSTGWTAILTNMAASNPVSFVDSNAVGNPGFYRVGRLPNP